ncbi:hypothetical protein MAPG_11190 [Magnaporthiopsis poae ATCC 64411]|uniref:Tyrosinase copper-binding domain-containing protein n=1 Tax=Magnaporthiopsis poae (strain ATCC 64411 / 73-15) TaxID=644358 RepID=A0A0C4EEL6_MAGP6|nr:hypothetical protein MAPG_11190 [Magnaporthiopsis poae ATCC 64411]
MLPLALLGLVAAATATAIPAPRDNKCTSPEVRKEWRELSSGEKAEYLRAAKCLRELPKKKYAEVDVVKTRMDELVWTHFSLNLDIHFVANFLPWHRWFVKLHEDMLRNECNFKGTQPYWDWSIDADALNTVNSPIHSIIFGDMGPATSPNEPLFMLHHANVDRAWARWEGRNATRLADYAGFNDRSKARSASINDEMPVMQLSDVAPVVSDYMDIQGGPLCYTYSKMTL